MNDLYFQARRTFPPLPSCTALGIYINEELIRILIYCLFPHILVHLGPCLGKHFSTVGIFGLFPSKAWASMSFLGSTPMCTGLCWYLALCIAPKPKRTGAGWSHQIDGIEGNKKKGSFSASHHFRNVLTKKARSRVKIHSVPNKTNDIKSCLQKCWAEPLLKSRWYDEKPGHMRHWQSPLAPQRSFQIRSLPITWVTQESTNAAEKPGKLT